MKENKELMRVIKKWELIFTIITSVLLAVFAFSIYLDIQICCMILKAKEGSEILYFLYLFFAFGLAVTISIAYLLYMRFRRAGC
jgi:hypothetical protein